MVPDFAVRHRSAAKELAPDWLWLGHPLARPGRRSLGEGLADAATLSRLHSAGQLTPSAFPLTENDFNRRLLPCYPDRVTFRSLLVWLLIWCSVLSPVQAANLLKMGQIQAWGENHRCHYPINASDPDGLQPSLFIDPMGTSQRKLGRPGFKNAWDYGKIVGGMALVIPAAQGTARPASLAYKGIRSLGFGRAGVMAFLGAHGQELVDTVEGAMLPAGAPTSSFALGLNVHPGRLCS